MQSAYLQDLHPEFMMPRFAWFNSESAPDSRSSLSNYRLFALLHYCAALVVFAAVSAGNPNALVAQDSDESTEVAKASEAEEAQDSAGKIEGADIGALKMRSIGPALTSGRIGDIVVDSERPNTWYVGAASGNIWKTVNAGTTWQPIFENYGSYSIGCLAIDPSNTNTIWVGTGENNGGRHIGCLLYTSPSPRDRTRSRMPSSA